MFSGDIAAEFNAGNIHAPVHLDGGNEAQLIDIFKHVRSDRDWIFCSWRSHYKALLHGIPAATVKAAIMAGRSISLCFPEQRFYSSAIVGGHLPIALGAAWSISRLWAAPQEAMRVAAPEIAELALAPRPRVWAFLGDMAALGGMYRECWNYARGHLLPITFVIEDNSKSVCTDTQKAWGIHLLNDADEGGLDGNPSQVEYAYTPTWLHSGAGKRVEF